MRSSPVAALDEQLERWRLGDPAQKVGARIEPDPVDRLDEIASAQAAALVAPVRAQLLQRDSRSAPSS
jgi:hypothetical protein